MGLLRFIRKLTGYYELKAINKKQEKIIHNLQLLCKKIKDKAQETLDTNPYGGYEIYKIGLRKIVADASTAIDLEQKNNSDSLFEDGLSE